MPPTKFWLNATYHSGADDVWRFSRWPTNGGHIRYQTRIILAFWISMSLPCLPSSLCSIHIKVWEEMSFEEFQDGPHGGHLRCWNGMNLVLLNLHVSPMPPSKFQLNLTYRSRADIISRFSSWPPWHGGHLGYWNWTNLAILNLHVTPMLPTKVELNPTYHLGADMVWRFSRWPPGGHLGYQNRTILAILNLFVAPMLPSSFSSMQLSLGGDVVWRFSRWLT